MKILGIESASTVASVALIEDGTVLCDFTLNGKYTHSKTIMPMLEAVKTIGDIDFSEVDAVAVSGGPGSYTGLRIGASTAKGLAQVWEVPIVSVSTIESLANNVSETDKIICPMLDARRKHAFCGAYRYEEGQLVNLVPIDLRSVEEFASLLLTYEGNYIILGDGLKSHRKLVEEFMPEERWEEARAIDGLPKASTLALVAEQKFLRGESESYMEHQPDYYRPSQAERELKNK